MTFWIITAALAIVVAALLVLALLRRGGDEEHPAAYDLRVYRDQLKEVDRDLARGVISPDDAERARAEISRRILAADAQLQQVAAAPARSDGPRRAVAAVTGVAVVAGAMALYMQLGAPGYGDLALKDRITAAQQARETRPDQAKAEAQLPPDPNRPEPAQAYLELMEKLREAVAARPDDVQGAILLARNEAALGNFKAAYTAQQKVLSLKGDQATGQDYADYADMMILAAGGYVSPQAETALRAALTRDPGNGAARYYMGLMALQTGRPDQAFNVWNALLRKGPGDAPWIAPIRAQIEEVAARAGQHRFALAPLDSAPAAGGLRGPSTEDVENAAQMSAEDRQNMIRNMVANLSDRLASEGGTPAEWARLISAYGVLGETERAKAIWSEAQVVFDGKPDALAEVRAAALRAGLAE